MSPTTFLKKHHHAFSLEKNEWINLVQLDIDTGNASPIKQPVRRLPFAARQEVAYPLKKMQDMGVLKPSTYKCSPIYIMHYCACVRVCVYVYLCVCECVCTIVALGPAPLFFKKERQHFKVLHRLLEVECCK